MTLFSPSVYKGRQQKAAVAVQSQLKDSELLVIHSGHPPKKPGGLDQAYDFLPHPLYFWLTGHRRPAGVFVISKNEIHGEFQRNLTSTEIVWEGEQWNFFSEKSLIDFENLKKQFSVIIDLGLLPGTETEEQKERAFSFHILLDQVRRKKDAAEVKQIRHLASLANKGYEALAVSVAAGVSERTLQLIYENAVLQAGAEKMPYGSIVGTGENSAILHAVPSAQKLKSGEMVLVDAGADIQDYCVDITRMFPVSGQFSSRQQDIYDIVLTAQIQAIDQCQIGNQWKDVHLLTAEIIAEGLSDFGFFKTSVSDVVESGAISVFYPHGVGHLVGLKVRDTGVIENRNPKRYAGANLRVDLKLEEGFCITVEPGCYFPRAFIEDPAIREKYHHHINWSEAEKWKNFGGIRLEDDILITSKGPDVLTSVVPK